MLSRPIINVRAHPRRGTQGVRRFIRRVPTAAEPFADKSLTDLRREYRDAHWSEMYSPPEVRGPGSVLYRGRWQSPEYAQAAGNTHLKRLSLAAEIRRRGHNPPRGF
jgi:hypothetical protein